MPDPADPAATLEEIRGRRAARKQYGLGFDPVDGAALLAAVETVLKLAGEWDASGDVGRQFAAKGLREAISRELTGKEGSDGHD